MNEFVHHNLGYPPGTIMLAIETTRLRLEPQTYEHAREMFHVLSDPALYEFENEPPPNLSWLQSRFKTLESRRSPEGEEQWLNWVIRYSDAGLVGYVQATIHQRGQSAVIAFVLSSAYWGRGLAREATEAIIWTLINHDRVKSIWAVLKRTNGRSLRMLERLEFVGVSPVENAPVQIDSDELLMQLRPLTLSQA